MKTKLLSAFVLAPAIFAARSHAEAPASAPTAQAPAVVSASPALVPNQTIYAAQLPSVQDLTNAATAQGITAERIEQTTTKITIVYKFQNGQTSTVAYQLLPTANGAPTAPPTVVTAAPPVTTVVTSPAPTVVYQPAPRVIYYDPVYYSRPWYREPPVSFRVGVGFGPGYYSHRHWHR